MALWLFKEEPESYSFADLRRDGRTTWSGVSNALAQKHLRAAKVGDRVFFYHTGGEKAVVGIMEVAADPAPDPAEIGEVVAFVISDQARYLTATTVFVDGGIMHGGGGL